MLAIDGGGVRAVLALEILAELEKLLAERVGKDRGIEPEAVYSMAAVEYVTELRTIGRRVAASISLADFGSFVEG